MALYDGFFDAVQDETTEEYDRAYSSGDFTGYFANVIGSGVCVHDNPDSFKAEYEGSTLYLRPGYLFIQGYWLANKAGEGETNYKGYAVTLPTGMTGSMAVVAHLNLGQRLIEIEVRAVSQAYPDALVLAIVTTSTAEDTRHNTDICGVIDTAGELSSKVEWAMNYIDTEIESKLQQVEQDIAAQDAKLDAKIAEVQAVADSITPPPIGSIKFSASQNVGEEWLKCDGSFVNEADYPELVEALGKLTPSGDKFQLISSGEIGPQISNGVLYGGRLWVYSYSAKKLYGIDVEGTAGAKEIAITSEDVHFGNFLPPSNTSPLTLSVAAHTSGSGAKLFLSQIKANGSVYRMADETMTEAEAYENTIPYFLLFQAEFSGSETSLSLSPAFTALDLGKWRTVEFSPSAIVPSVVSHMQSREENYYCATGVSTNSNSGGHHYLLWKDGGAAAVKIDSAASTEILQGRRTSFSAKNKGEMVSVSGHAWANSFGDTTRTYGIYSTPNKIFNADGNYTSMQSRDKGLPLTVCGQDKVLVAFDKNLFPWLGTTENESDAASPGLSLPNYARIFADGGAYLWGKDIYMIFVGTGVIFSRTLADNDFGYLDTTSVLGIITQFGYLDYSQDEETLYLLGQDTTNTVKVAKIVLNTLYDYANDGAWLPMIASDGVPAYIKAKEAEQ